MGDAKVRTKWQGEIESPYGTIEVERRQVWVQAWCATANSSTCTKPEVATGFADICLEEFDKRFPAP